MTADPATLLAQYEASINQLKQMLTIVPPEQRDIAPAPGEWTARQVLIHLADSEILGAARLRLTLAENEPTLYMYNQPGWAAGLDYAGASPEDAIALAMVLRRSTLNLLRRMPPEAWQRRCMHPARGAMTVADLVQMYIDHISGHTAQLEQIFASAGQE